MGNLPRLAEFDDTGGAGRADAVKRLLGFAVDLAEGGELVALDLRLANGTRVSLRSAGGADDAGAGDDAAAAASGSGRPGMYLSPLEAQVCGVLSAGPLSGKQIAAAMRREYNTALKYLLSNLEERNVLAHDAREGYSLAQAATPAADGGAKP